MDEKGTVANSFDLAEESVGDGDNASKTDSSSDKTVDPPENAIGHAIGTQKDTELSGNSYDGSDEVNSEFSKQSSDIDKVNFSEKTDSFQNHIDKLKHTDEMDNELEDNKKSDDKSEPMEEGNLTQSINTDLETDLIENNQNDNTIDNTTNITDNSLSETKTDEDQTTDITENSKGDNKIEDDITEENKSEKKIKDKSIDITESSNETDTEDSQKTDEQKDQDAKLDENKPESDLKDDNDDLENPQFENASNVVEETQEDHTQALDPFDALLKGSDSTTETPAVTEPIVNADNDDDDDHNADDDQNIDGDIHDDEHTDEPGELIEEPGADEEVCLLPDTEREISEADKAEAEKVLAEKRKQAEASAAEASLTKVEDAAMDIEDPSEVVNVAVNNDDTAETMDVTTEDASQENGADKDVENEETAETDDAINNIQEISPVFGTCLQCCTEQSCIYRFNKNSEVKYICTDACVKKFLDTHPGHTVLNKKYLIEEITPKLMTCSECEETKICYFYYNYDGEHTNYCSLSCLHSMMADEKEKYIFKRRKIFILEEDPVDETCEQCNIKTLCPYTFQRYGDQHFICSNGCIKTLNEGEDNRYKKQKKKRVPKKPPQPAPAQQIPTVFLNKELQVVSKATDKYLGEAYKVQQKTPDAIQAAREDRKRSFVRKCMQCNLVLTLDEKNLNWETMDFCNEGCLGRYQNKIGARCANCKNCVTNVSLGKYCVRFGYDIRQFCNSSCLEEFKKGLKICCYCQRDISAGHQGFLAPVGDKGQFKDFCSQVCMEKFDQMSKNPVPPSVWAKCAVCSIDKHTTIEVEVNENSIQRLCSEPCFAAFKFVNSICPDQCRWCKKHFERKSKNCFTIYDNSTPLCFCSKSCINVYISNTRHIVPCNWCKVKKYNFDMIRRNLSNGQNVMMCSLNCLNLYQVSVNAVSSRRIKCDMCKRSSLAQYHLTMSDATVRNFCTYHCVMAFQGQYAKHAPPLVAGEQSVEQQKAVPTGAPRRTYSATTHKNNAVGKQQSQQQRSGLPVISNVLSLATPPPLLPAPTRGKSKRIAQQPPPELEPPKPVTPPPPPKPLTPPPPPPPKIYNHVLVKTIPPKEVCNKATLTKPMMVSKGVSCRPHPCTKECQTDPSLERRVLIPVPVPIYVPVPCAMYSLPFPVPVPIPMPIPVPVFIPTTRNSAKGIMKEISKIHDKMPTDPFEAELLMMAEMVAGDKKKDQSDSETDEEPAPDEGFSPVPMDGNNAFGEDMLQMALKMATEYEEPAVDLESAMTANTITPSSHPGMPGLEGEGMHHHHMMVLEQQRAVAALRASAAPRKRVPPAAAPPAAAPARPTRASKRRRAEPAPVPQPEPPREPAEKPDANMCLKYTFGVNAWKQWVMTKNAEIEKSSIRRKPFKSEILQLTADELNYSLCLFVKEVRKPNGSEYAPDTIYYLVLGIQQYLFENGRIDNIFTDPYYEKFTDCLDEVARKFSVLYNDSQYIVTRVEEEHLWESKQLGAHSPHVLLSTLMFFNTKHFNLVTVEEHMQLSFSHIMKHWKRNPNQPGQAKLPGSRNVLLRFYPPQSALEANSRKKKVYEQQENEDNPLRCPVKLYEFYISKCPESVRTRNDVFYLQPERSCVPDSPVWYSTQPLSRDALAKMLHRVKMVKEINIALLTS